jgi:hypothetical protein
LVIFTFYLSPPVKLTNWFNDLPCLGMENQPINGSQEMLVKPIIPQSINIMKVDHDDDKEKCNAVADKGLFKSTN